jgi:hypothetical protein
VVMFSLAQVCSVLTSVRRQIDGVLWFPFELITVFEIYSNAFQEFSVSGSIFRQYLTITRVKYRVGVYF